MDDDMPSARDIKRALARIRDVLPRERRVVATYRDMRLGLERISRIVPESQKWMGVHVGGTNGKGSICALLGGMMKRAGFSHAVFVSPALPERHNGVLINGKYVNRRMYETELADVEAAYRRLAAGWRFSSADDPGDLTPFELETAAALRIFDKMNVKYGIVEAGMGGATDATNAMRDKSITVISRIGLDHQEYLGSTVEDIAAVKAGIMRRDVPCVVDYSNSKPVLDVLMACAERVGTQITLSSKAEPLLAGLDRGRFPLDDHEQQNLLCAAATFQCLFPSLKPDVNKLLASEPWLPARKELVSVSRLTGGSRQRPVLVDGAHNMLGADALAKHVDGRVRQHTEPVTWVMGLSHSTSKPTPDIIEALVRPHDNLAFVEYDPGLNDPPAVPAELGRDIAQELLRDESQLYDGESDLETAMLWACHRAGQGPIVVTGSFYLARDLLGLEGIDQQRTIGTRPPGRAQLSQYMQLSQERALTPEEETDYERAREHWFLSRANASPGDEQNRGSPPQPPKVSSRIQHLKETAAHHKKQADGYLAAIESIEKDLELAAPESEDSAPGSHSDPRQSVEALRRRHEEHTKAYKSIMLELLEHVMGPKEEYLVEEDRTEEARKKRVSFLMRLYGEDEPVRPVDKMAPSREAPDDADDGPEPRWLDEDERRPPGSMASDDEPRRESLVEDALKRGAHREKETGDQESSWAAEDEWTEDGPDAEGGRRSRSSRQGSASLGEPKRARWSAREEPRGRPSRFLRVDSASFEETPRRRQAPEEEEVLEKALFKHEAKLQRRLHGHEKKAMQFAGELREKLDDEAVTVKGRRRRRRP